MKISLTETGKRFNREWIFRKLSFIFEPGRRYAITGSNGSGKSTLLQVIAGAIAPNEGKILYALQEKSLAPEQVFSQISFCAPYLELIEEMTGREFLAFHRAFKPFLEGHTEDSILEELGLSNAAAKQIRYYSSGMKQRIKLSQAIYTETPVVLLDEPCSNLDLAGIQLYHALVEKYCAQKLVIVSSNDPEEYRFCSEILKMSQWKTDY